MLPEAVLNRCDPILLASVEAGNLAAGKSQARGISAVSAIEPGSDRPLCLPAKPVVALEGPVVKEFPAKLAFHCTLIFESHLTRHRCFICHVPYPSASSSDRVLPFVPHSFQSKSVGQPLQTGGRECTEGGNETSRGVGA